MAPVFRRLILTTTAPFSSLNKNGIRFNKKALQHCGAFLFRFTDTFQAQNDSILICLIFKC
jgi:hypothetical protein